MTTQDYNKLLNAISNVRNQEWGYAIVGIKGYNHYVQFSQSIYSQSKADELYVEAASHLTTPLIENKENEFRSIGYAIDVWKELTDDNKQVDINGHYGKLIESHITTAFIADEIVYIFENIYGIEFKNIRIEYDPYPSNAENGMTMDEAEAQFRNDMQELRRNHERMKANEHLDKVRRNYKIGLFALAVFCLIWLLKYIIWG